MFENKKVLRIKNSIRQNASELKSSLSDLFRPSHLPYKAKSEKCSIFVLVCIFPNFPYYPLKGLPIEAPIKAFLSEGTCLNRPSMGCCQQDSPVQGNLLIGDFLRWLPMEPLKGIYI